MEEQNSSYDELRKVSESIQNRYERQKVLMNFTSYLEEVAKNPSRAVRTSAAYLKDTFDHFGRTPNELNSDNTKKQSNPQRFKVFDISSPLNGPIIGGERVHEQIYKTVCGFVQQGRSDKLILLHGPNGSAKSSTVDALARALDVYSQQESGAVYTFNWIFPTDRSATPSGGLDQSAIGFGSKRVDGDTLSGSYALIDESKVSCKITSEFRDNPLYLIPMPQRENLLKSWFATALKIPEDEVCLPPHILTAGLSKKNQLIFENLLSAYNGDLDRTLRHIQIERFFYSKQYRVGVATVEPQLAIDAREQQLTMDKNLANLPSILQNIRFHEASGPIVEANRGMLEYSDMLKRPVDAYKYLLATIEKASLTLPSSTANIDIVFFGTTNDKHFDAFKALPDFSSFRSRFELITVPYLLKASLEKLIYKNDIAIIKKSKPVAPHVTEVLSKWAVMTRYKQPDLDQYPAEAKDLIARISPFVKMKIYDSLPLQPVFKANEEIKIRELKNLLENESLGTPIYEGRFGASPRELRTILYRASQTSSDTSLTPVSIFRELRILVRDRSVYEYLQFEPRELYHDAAKFIDLVEQDFEDTFDRELSRSMNLISEDRYDAQLNKYVEHALAFVRNEKIYNPSTSSYQTASVEFMEEFEKIAGVQGEPKIFRENLIGKIAAFKLDHRGKDIDLSIIFGDLLERIRNHFHLSNKKQIDSGIEMMLILENEQSGSLTEDQRKIAESAFQILFDKFGYDHASAKTCLSWLMRRRKKSENLPPDSGLKKEN